jgi:hypothetical protein
LNGRNTVSPSHIGPLVHNGRWNWKKLKHQNLRNQAPSVRKLGAFHRVIPKTSPAFQIYFQRLHELRRPGFIADILIKQYRSFHPPVEFQKTTKPKRLTFVSVSSKLIAKFTTKPIAQSYPLCFAGRIFHDQSFYFLFAPGFRSHRS